MSVRCNQYTCTGNHSTMCTSYLALQFQFSTYLRCPNALIICRWCFFFLQKKFYSYLSDQTFINYVTYWANVKVVLVGLDLVVKALKSYNFKLLYYLSCFKKITPNKISGLIKPCNSFVCPNRIGIFKTTQIYSKRHSAFF